MQSSHPSSGGVWSPAYRSLTLGLILSVSATAYEALAVATIMPNAVAELGGLALYGWAFAAFMLANLLALVLAGSAIDRYGAMAPFSFGSLVFLAGLLLAGFAPNMPLLIGGRAIQGAGAGFISATAYVAIGRAYPEALRSRMLALFSSAWVIPGLAGPGLAGLIGDYIGWRWVFISVLPFPLIALVCAAPALRAIAPNPGAQLAWNRIGNALLLVLGVILFSNGLSASLPLLRVALPLSGLLLMLVALRRLMPAGTLRAAPGMPAAIVLMGLLNLVFFGVDAFVPLALSEIRNQSAAFTGITLTAATLAWTSGAWLQASTVDRLPRHLLAAGGLLLVALGSAGIGLIVLPELPVVLAPIVWAIAGLGIGMAYSTASLTVLNEAPAGTQGTSTSAMQLAAMLGTSLGTSVGGVLVDAAATPALGIQIHVALMVGLGLLAALIALRLGPQRRVAPSAATPAVQEL